MMRPSNKVRNITEKDLIAISNIHLSSFTKSALTTLGHEVVRRQYEWLLNGPHNVIPICAVDSEDRILGFCFAGKFNGASSGFIKKNSGYLIKKVLTHPWMLLNKTVFEKAKKGLSIIFRSIRKPKKKTMSKPSHNNNSNIVQKKYCTLLAIAVDPLFQKKGIGKIIINEVELQAKEKGFEIFTLTVHPDNIPAVNFYLNNGWEKKANGENWNGIMYKNL